MRSSLLSRVAAIAMGACLVGLVAAQAAPEAVNLHDLKSDLVVPEVAAGLPGPGKRVRQINPGYEGWDLYHILYLPGDWSPQRKYPVIVEYPGNGGYTNQYGDVSSGRLEDCKLGCGISGGRGFIWVSLPFVDTKSRRHAIQWWGDPERTAAYCRQTVARICRDYGGDPGAVILTGFSRGAIACSYIGLRDEETAKLWRALIAHSHYDGVRRWGYAEDDTESAQKRVRRFQGKPQFITQENSVSDIEAFFKAAKIGGATLVPLPYPNHTDVWVLKDVPERKQLRDWLTEILKR
jgi:hypothetical protein